MRVIWSDAAKLAYEKLIDHLLEIWEVEVALNLDQLVYELEESLKNNKHLCPKSKKRGLRKCTVHKLTSLIYKVNQNTIEVVTVLHNRSGHDY